MVTTSRVAIYVFWLCAIAGPASPLGVKATGLRARAPPARTSDAASPADVEDSEDLLDSDSDQPPAADQAAVTQLLSQAALPATVPQPVFAAVPQLSVPATPRSEAPAVMPSLPVTEPEEAVFQFSPPPMEHPLAMALKAEMPTFATKVHVAEASHVAPKMPSWLQSNATSEESMPKNWPPSGNKYNQCDPPCIQGRGFCNDNMCFCRSPYAGSTCQHKTTDLYRAPRPMAVGFAVTCFVLGIVMSKIIFSFSEHAIETRLQRYGQGKQRFEMWAPPEDKTKNKKAPPAKKVDTGM